MTDDATVPPMTLARPAATTRPTVGMTTTGGAAISTRGLRKSFGDKVVLDGIDLHVADGSIYSLLGPNGAGKTTMIHILSTLIDADGGDAWVAGHHVADD